MVSSMFILCSWVKVCRVFGVFLISICLVNFSFSVLLGRLNLLSIWCMLWVRFLLMNWW